jgi:hypothetical protein
MPGDRAIQSQLYYFLTTPNNLYIKQRMIMPFQFEAATYSASLPGRVKRFIFIARPLVAHPVKG